MCLFFFLEDSDGNRKLKSQLWSDASDITAALLSEKQSHSVDEAISDSPLLHSSLTSTLIETLVHLFDWFFISPFTK